MDELRRGSVGLRPSAPAAQPPEPGSAPHRRPPPASDDGLLPNLVLAALLALVVTYAAVNLVVGALGEKFRDDLALSRLSAGKAMVRLEDNNLRLLREMIFTEGVDEAIVAQDVDRLERLLAPIAANARVPYVDVIRADGAALLALRSPELGPDAAQRLDPGLRTWPPVRAVLAGELDEQGDKYADIVYAPWGPLFVTAAPVRGDGRLHGAISVAYPIEELAARLSDDAGSQGTTLYRLDGSPVVTTVRGSPDSMQRNWWVPTVDAERIVASDQILLRQVSADGAPFMETVASLVIRRRPVMLLGISSPAEIIDRSSTQARNWMLMIFGVALALIVGVRLVLGRRGVLRARAEANGKVG